MNQPPELLLFVSKFSEVRTVARRNSLYQILATNAALGVGQRAKTWLSHTPIPLGAGLSGGACYSELRRIPIPRTRVNSASPHPDALTPYRDGGDCYRELPLNVSSTH